MTDGDNYPVACLDTLAPLKSIDLKTIFLFGGTLSLASALQTTGAGEDIAKAVIGVLGE